MDVSTININKDTSTSTSNLYDRKYAEFVKHVLRETAAEFEREQKFSDKTLLDLYNVFGDAFERGLELYEQYRIIYISVIDSSNIGISKDRTDTRWLLQIKGFSGSIYTIFPEINFCTCAAFRIRVLNNKSSFTCKHVLAGWLASLDKQKLTYKEITHKHFQDLLQYLVS